MNISTLRSLINEHLALLGAQSSKTTQGGFKSCLQYCYIRRQTWTRLTHKPLCTCDPVSLRPEHDYSLQWGTVTQHSTCSGVAQDDLRRAVSHWLSEGVGWIGTKKGTLKELEVSPLSVLPLSSSSSSILRSKQNHISPSSDQAAATVLHCLWVLCFPSPPFLAFSQCARSPSLPPVSGT